MRFALAVCAAERDPVPRPEVNPGDSWSYRRMDYHANHDGLISDSVTFANERVIQTVGKRGRDDKEIDSTYTRACSSSRRGPVMRTNRATRRGNSARCASNRISGTSKETAWYAPEVKRYVKWTFENWTFKGRNQWWGPELLEYKVQ